MNLRSEPARRRVGSAAVDGIGRVALIGPLVAVASYVFALIMGARFDASSRESFWQFIPEAELSADPAGSLWYFHAQPPMVNLPFVVTDRLGQFGPPILQALLLVVALGLVLLVGDTIFGLTGNRASAVVASTLAGLLPATTFYALWLYPTLPIALLLVLTMWGLVRGAVGGRRWPLVVSAMGVTALFLVRATVAWPVALAWLAGVAWVVMLRDDRRRLLRALGVTAVVCLAVISTLTIKNLVLFATPTQSSWAKENYANVVLNVLTDAEEAQVAGTDPCLAELVAVGTFEPLESYPICLAEAGWAGPTVHTAVLDEARWGNGAVNYNHRDRLILSERWGDLVATSLRTNPSLVLRVLMPMQVNGNHDWGSPVLLFGPSTRYVFVKENVGQLGAVGQVWALAFAWVPPVAVLAWLIGLALVLGGRLRRVPAGRAYVVASLLVGLLSCAYLLLEFGENQRFQVEVVYAWIILGAASLTWLIEIRATRRRADRASDPVSSRLARGPGFGRPD